MSGIDILFASKHFHLLLSVICQRACQSSSHFLQISDLVPVNTLLITCTAASFRLVFLCSLNLCIIIYRLLRGGGSMNSLCSSHNLFLRRGYHCRNSCLMDSSGSSIRLPSMLSRVHATSNPSKSRCGSLNFLHSPRPS